MKDNIILSKLFCEYTELHTSGQGTLVKTF